MKSKRLIFLFITLLLFVVSADTFGQCAMCKAVAESAGEKQAEGLNNGINFSNDCSLSRYGSYCISCKETE